MHSLNLLQSRSGFTLMEMLMVIIVIGLLAAIVMPSMTNVADDLRRLETEREMLLLARSITGDEQRFGSGQRVDFGYVGDVGSFPPALEWLWENKGAYATWRGPYLPPGFVQDSLAFKTDDWGFPYQYDGQTIFSVGSGTTLSRTVARSLNDFLRNRYTGSITDAFGRPPSALFSDSVLVEITYPDGLGSMASRTVPPDTTGQFAVDSLPVGCHRLRIIYLPAGDTLVRFITIFPRQATKGVFRFADDYFSFISEPDLISPGRWV